MISSREALQRLKDGNGRFVAGQLQTDATHYSRQLVANVDGQTPFAMVLGAHRLMRYRTPTPFVA